MTMTARLDRATFQRRWSDEIPTILVDYETELSADGGLGAELRAFCDFLHELDVPGLVAMADDLAGERLAETAEWPAWAELDEPPLDGEIVINVPITVKQAREIRERFGRATRLIITPDGDAVQRTSLTFTEPDPVQAYWDADNSDDLPGRPVLLPTRNPLAEAYARTAALTRQRKAQAPSYPDTPEQIADQQATARALTDGQHKAQGWTPTRPWHRRAWAATKRAALRLDAWAERIGKDK